MVKKKAGDPNNRRRLLKSGKKAAHLRGRARSLDEAERTMVERQNDFLAAFVELRGMIGLACKQAKVPRRTLYNWLESNTKNGARFREKYDDARVEIGDLIELRGIAKQADQGNYRAAEKMLAAKYPERGYGVNKTELSGPGGKPMEVTSPTLEEVADKTTLRGLENILSRVQKSVGNRTEEEDDR